jgi:hypothetical protein
MQRLTPEEEKESIDNTNEEESTKIFDSIPDTETKTTWQYSKKDFIQLIDKALSGRSEIGCCTLWFDTAFSGLTPYQNAWGQDWELRKEVFEHYLGVGHSVTGASEVFSSLEYLSWTQVLYLTHSQEDELTIFGEKKTTKRKATEPRTGGGQPSRKKKSLSPLRRIANIAEKKLKSPAIAKKRPSPDSSDEKEC